MNVFAEPSGAGFHVGLERLVHQMRVTCDLLDNLSDLVALYDPSGIVVAGNGRARRLVGWTSESADMHFSAHLPATETARIQMLFDATLRDEAPPEFETQFTHVDGTTMSVLARLVPARVDGTIVGVYGIATDLDAQRSLERVFVNNAQKFRSLFEHHTDAIVIIDEKGRFASVNLAAEDLCGYLNEELVHKPVSLLFKTRAGDSRVVDVARSAESARFHRTLNRKDGSRVEVEGETIPIIIDGNVRGFFAVARDITLRRAAEAEIAKQAHRIRQLYRIALSMQSTPEEQVVGALELGLKELGFDWAYVGRVDGTMLTVTHSVGERKLFPVGHAQPLEDTLMRHVIEHHGIFIVEDLTQPPWSTDRSNRAKIAQSYVGIPIRVNGKSWGAVGIVSAQKRVLSQTEREYIVALVGLATASVERGLHHERLDALAFLDTLTTIPNRLLFMDRLEQQLNFAKRRKRSFAILYVDFDRFKWVNDTYGHAVGDAFLIEMARRFTEAARESDTVARLGGDEFVILQPEITDAENATEFAARLIETTLEPIVVGDVTISPSASIGVSIYPHDGLDGDTLLKNADTALYCVKAAGRNGYALYETNMEARPRPRGANG